MNHSIESAYFAQMRAQTGRGSPSEPHSRNWERHAANMAGSPHVLPRRGMAAVASVSLTRPQHKSVKIELSAYVHRSVALCRAWRNPHGAPDRSMQQLCDGARRGRTSATRRWREVPGRARRTRPLLGGRVSGPRRRRRRTDGEEGHHQQQPHERRLASRVWNNRNQTVIADHSTSRIQTCTDTHTNTHTHKRTNTQV